MKHLSVFPSILENEPLLRAAVIDREHKVLYVDYYLGIHYIISEIIDSLGARVQFSPTVL